MTSFTCVITLAVEDNYTYRLGIWFVWNTNDVGTTPFAGMAWEIYDCEKYFYHEWFVGIFYNHFTCICLLQFMDLVLLTIYNFYENYIDETLILCRVV